MRQVLTVDQYAQVASAKQRQAAQEELYRLVPLHDSRAYDDPARPRMLSLMFVCGGRAPGPAATRRARRKEELLLRKPKPAPAPAPPVLPQPALVDEGVMQEIDQPVLGPIEARIEEKF